MPIQTSYRDRMPVAFAGMLADTSLRQVDGATAAQSAVQIGRPVIVVSADNNTKIARNVTEADLAGLANKFLGISLHSHYAAVTGQYEIGDAVNVVRVGRVWALTGLTAAPSAGAGVRFVVGGTPAAASVNTTGGTLIGGWAFTGGFETQLDGSHIAEIELTIPQSVTPTPSAG